MNGWLLDKQEHLTRKGKLAVLVVGTALLCMTAVVIRAGFRLYTLRAAGQSASTAATQPNSDVAAGATLHHREPQFPLGCRVRMFDGGCGMVVLQRPAPTGWRYDVRLPRDPYNTAGGAPYPIVEDVGEFEIYADRDEMVPLEDLKG